MEKPVETNIRQNCEICGKEYPLTVEHFSFCIHCGRIICRSHCLRTCVLCGRERCAVCLEEIAKAHKTSGEICEKCALLKSISSRNRGFPK